MGGFHFNDKKYADDDVTVGSIDPYQLFLIFCELVGSDGKAIDVAYMIDQSHNLKPKIEAMIQSVLNIQTATPKPCSWTGRSWLRRKRQGTSFQLRASSKLLSKLMSGRCLPRFGRSWTDPKIPWLSSGQAATLRKQQKSGADIKIPAKRGIAGKRCPFLL